MSSRNDQPPAEPSPASAMPETADASFDAKTFLATLTELPGVYRMIDGKGEVIYVGKAKNLKKRVSSYFQKTLSSPRTALMVSQIRAVETTVTPSEAEALLLENNLIKRLNPRYNILFRDDKSYPYIVISRESFPRLFFHRGVLEKNADNFGPFPAATAVRESIGLLQKTFRLRTCEDAVFRNRSRPCLLHQIRRCSGPCVGLVDEATYAEDVRLASLFLRGRHDEVIKRLGAAMQKASEALAFEQAALLRDQIQALRRVQEQQSIESGRNEDVDIVVAVEQNGLLCLNLAMVRAGRHLGDRTQFPNNASAALPAEVIGAFIRQHYLDQPPPHRILVNRKPGDTDLAEIADALALLANRAVPVAVPRLGIGRSWVEMAEQNALLAITAQRMRQALAGERAEALKNALQLSETPARIECFDISHTGGEATVASCVVWHEGAMRRSDYRRFNIRDVKPGDDYAAIRQAVFRRYDRLASGEGVRPDLVLIDGGKGQVASAWSALAELGLTDLPMIGVAKGEARKAGEEMLIFPEGSPLVVDVSLPSLEMKLRADSPALHLIQEVRDEAHRFAVFGHRAQRGKVRKTSRLEEIPGVGPSRRRALLARFGGLQEILSASIDELAKTPGVSHALAETIYRALH